jgi:hypothetical protein
LPAIDAGRLRFQQFHGDEGSPIGLVNFVDRADIQTVQRKQPRLPLETAEAWGSFASPSGGTSGDVTTELDVLCLINHTYPAPRLAEDACGNHLPHGLGGIAIDKNVRSESGRSISTAGTAGRGRDPS